MERKKPSRSHSKTIDFESLKIYHDLENCTELHRLEADGFIRGTEKGKTMNVPLWDLEESLRKQYRDWIKASVDGNVHEMKRTLADLRNLAGCVFLKIQEKEAKKTT